MGPDKSGKGRCIKEPRDKGVGEKEGLATLFYLKTLCIGTDERGMGEPEATLPTRLYSRMPSVLT